MGKGVLTKGSCHFLLALLVACGILTACGGLAPEAPVNLPVPFSQAMDSNSRVVLVDGNPVGSGALLTNLKFQQTSQGCNGKSFAAFNSNGSTAGNCYYDESRMANFAQNGDQSQFTMPVCCVVDGGDVVVADSAKFFEFPYEDPTRDVCALLPSGESCDGAHFMRGGASGIITMGSGSFRAGVGSLSLEHRYGAVVKGDGANRRVMNFIDSVWILHRKAN